MVPSAVGIEQPTDKSVPILAEGAELAPGYTVVGHLHRGDSLDVYEVWSAERECRCVAKTLCPECLDDAHDRGRLLREGRLLRGLTHPHIVRAYQTLMRPAPIVILETLTGETLESLIDESPRRLGLADVAVLGVQVCSAIAYLHRHDVLHLDLKPSNIMASQGIAKVIDLSLARRPGRSFAGVGTRAYMAPEQACGGIVSSATDVWGIGAVLYEAASGVPPFQTYHKGRYDQLERDATRIRAHRRLPARFAALVEACLDRVPARRPTIEEITSNLNRWT